MLMRFAANSSRGTSSSTTVPKPACAFRRISTIAKMNVILRSRKWKRSSKRARGKNMLRRLRMLEKQLRRRGVIDPVVLAAMATVPRHEFVPEEVRSHAYDDLPLPIGGGQTISQPYIVAAMTAALHLQPADRILEIGTGCGYQAAVLSHLAREVFSIERRPELASSAAAKLAHLGYSNAHVHCGDGTLGLPELAPFDAILVAAAAPARQQGWRDRKSTRLNSSHLTQYR